MQPNQLINGETILSHSDEGLITLTTHRIRYRNKDWGQSNFISIMLEKISSLQVVYVSYPILLIIGIIVILIGLIVGFNNRNSSEMLILPLVIGAVFIIAFFITKRHICIISPDGGSKIIFRTEGMSTDSLINMMDKIEQAKSNRVSQMQSIL